jgi:signal peptidase I
MSFKQERAVSYELKQSGPELVEAKPAKPEAAMHPVGTLPAVQSLIYIVIVALFLITFCVQPFRIPSESMEPTLLVGDFLLVDKQAVSGDRVDGDGAFWMPKGAIHRHDVIVFHDPVDPAIHLVKRVIGMPGDRLHLREGTVYVNGKPLSEAYTIYRPSPRDDFRDNFPRMQSADPSIDAAWWARLRGLVDHGDVVVPAGNYFVMGDNRNDSEDSRYWGFVPRAAIVGKPLVIYFSLREKSRDEDDDDAPVDADKHGWMDFARWGRTLRVIR